MNISRRQDEGVTVLALDGKLTIGDGDVALRDGVTDLIHEGVKKILLDLGGIKAMDSSGLGELIRMREMANRSDALIKLLHVEDKVREVLEMTRLIGVFETYDDPIDAIASFR